MEDGPTSTSAGGSSKGTVAGGTQSFGSEQKTKKELSPLSDSDSDGTIILDLLMADDEKDASVPVLTRTDSVILKKEMLGYTVEDSLSSSDVSEDGEYVPESDGTDSDSPAEEVVKQPKENVVVDSEASDAEDEDAAPSSSQSSGRSDENVPLVGEVSEAHATKDASGVVKKSTTDEIRNADLHPAQGRSDEKMPLVREVSEAHTMKGSSKSKKRKWGDDEIQAVEKTLLDYIQLGKVPGKAVCLKCIETSPLALRGRV